MQSAQRAGAEPPVDADANPNLVHLSDAQRILALFAQGISGRYMHLRPTESLTGQFRPDGGITNDGTAVYLPSAVGLFDVPRHNLGVYKIAVLHQLGFFENGTFTFDLSRARQRLPGLPADVKHAQDRAFDLERFFDLFEAGALMRRLFMTLEDMRIDLALRRRYPGARADLDRVLAHALTSRPAVLELAPFAALLESLTQYTLGAPRALLLTLDGTGMLGALLDALAPAEAEGASVYDTAAAAVACYGVLEAVGLPRKVELVIDGDADMDALDGDGGAGAPLDEDQMGAAPVEFRGEINPELVQRQLRSDQLVSLLDAYDLVTDDDISQEALDRLLKEMAEQGKPSSAPPLDEKPPMVDMPMQNTSLASGTNEAGMLANLQADQILQDKQRKAAEFRELVKRELEMNRYVLRRAFGDVDGAARSFFYDEWNFHDHAYIKGWCRLFEHRLQGDDYDFIHGVRQRHAVLAHQVKRQFKFLKPESYTRVKRVSDGEELDLDGIIEAVIDRRAGHVTDEHVYQRRQKAAREVSAAFLLDMSASTDDPVPDELAPEEPDAQKEEGEEDGIAYGYWAKGVKRPPEKPKRRVIDVAKESLALMCEALETLGDGYGIYGFSGYGHDEVEFYVAKEFNDKLSNRTWAALGAMKPRRSTRMGPAIRHAIKKLEKQDVRMKVMIIVSDGFPQDYDYGPDRTDHEYGIQDTAKALEEAEKKGIQTFCITIDQSGHDYLRRMCPDNRYLIIDEVKALPNELTKVYRTLTM